MSTTALANGSPAFLTRESPFTKMVILDYYDGPVAGAVECRQGGQAYCLNMLDWDDRQDVRIFSLAPLAPQDFERVARLDVRRRGEPVLKAEEAWSQIGDVLASAGPPECIAAWRGLGEVVLTARAIAPEDNLTLDGWFDQQEPSRDWFAFLGLKK